MEKRWLSAKDVIEQNLLSKIDLVFNVHSRKLTAYDYLTFASIDWNSAKERFEDIVKMADQKIPGLVQSNIEHYNPTTGIKNSLLSYVKKDVDPITIICPDEFADENGIITKLLQTKQPPT